MPFIYFIQAGESGPIKIGRSDEPRKRFVTLQVSHYETLNFLGCVQQDDIVENRLHRVLVDSRIRGEWFRPTPAVLALMSELLAGTSPQSLLVTPLKNLDQQSELPSTSELEKVVDAFVDAAEHPEKVAIVNALKKADGDITVAAKLLGCARRTLQERMREHKLPRGRGGRPRTNLTLPATDDPR